MRYTGNNVQVAVEAMACEGSGSSACGNLIINLKKNLSHETLNKFFSRSYSKSILLCALKCQLQYYRTTFMH